MLINTNVKKIAEHLILFVLFLLFEKFVNKHGRQICKYVFVIGYVSAIGFNNIFNVL